MLGNIVRQTFPLLHHERILFRRYSLSQTRLNVRNNGDIVSSKNQDTKKTDDDDDNIDEPLKYSVSKAAAMRTRDYRIPDDDTPWYQGHIVTISLAVFMIYFCILREENDIDLLLDRDLSDTFIDMQKRIEEREATKKNKS